MIPAWRRPAAMAAGTRAGRGRGKRGEAAHHREDESASRPAPHRAGSAARPRACAGTVSQQPRCPSRGELSGAARRRLAGAQHLTQDGGWRTRSKSGLVVVGEAEVVAQALEEWAREPSATPSTTTQIDAPRRGGAALLARRLVPNPAGEERALSSQGRRSSSARPSPSPSSPAGGHGRRTS